MRACVVAAGRDRGLRNSTTFTTVCAYDSAFSRMRLRAEIAQHFAAWWSLVIGHSHSALLLIPIAPAPIRSFVSFVVKTSSKSSESAAHLALKRLAVEWALTHRLALCATEVRLPRCNYRADVAACTPRVQAPNAFTAVFECKASRADYLRDGADERNTRAEIASLCERVQALRAMIGEHRPDLRRGEELFPEFESIDLRDTRHDTHARLTAKLRVAQNKLLEGTKFAKLARWRCASLLYLVSEDEIVYAHEVPDGWGLLVRQGDNLVLRLKPCLHATTEQQRVCFLERIAAATTRETRRALGLPLWQTQEPPC